MKQLFLSSLNRSINACLQLDPESKNRIQKLHGQSIGIELLPFHIVFHCHFEADQVRIEPAETAPIETIIRGTPFGLLSAIIQKKSRNRFFKEDVLVEGNAELAKDAIDLFDQLDIDWQEPLSHLIGDVPTHHLNEGIKKTSIWCKALLNSLKEDLSEYIHEEAEWLPTHEALQDFFNDIDNLRMSVDRMEAKINLILARHRKQSEDKL